MAIPKPVRQRMINVMYIVLLALLALQIPKEVTEAFLTINSGIENSNVALGKMTLSNITAIEQKGINGDKLAVDYGERSRQINASTNDLNNYIESIKNKIIETVGTDEEGKILSPEETILTNELLIRGNKNGVNDGLAFKLEDKISQGMKSMFESFPRENLDEFKEGSFDKLVSSLPIYNLVYNEINNSDWASNTFDQMPAAGAIAMLSQIQSEVKTSENKLIEEMKSLIRGETINFGAQIVAPSSYILQGDEFQADLFLTAFSSTNDNMSVVINGRNYKPGADGKVRFQMTENTIGTKTLKGHINLKDTNTGKVTKYPFNDFTYNVAAPYANVSPTMMNVFYIGVDNPINATAAGVLSQDIQVSVEGGKLIGSQGQYKVKVTKTGEATVTVRDKKGKVHGRFPFRVKKVPNPEPHVGQMPGGVMKPAKFRAQKALQAVMVNFDYDVSFRVVSYDMVYIPKNDDVAISSSNGEAFTSAMLSYVGKARPRDRYAFENIKVVGPDGEERRLPGINFRIIN